MVFFLFWGRSGRDSGCLFAHFIHIEQNQIFGYLINYFPTGSLCLMCCCGTHLHHSDSEQKKPPTNQPKKTPKTQPKKKRYGISCSASQNLPSCRCNNTPACTALLCFDDWRNAGEKSAHDWKYEKVDKKKKPNNFQVGGLLHLACTNSILNFLKDARSASHATTAEWQRNQKGW